MITFFTYFLQLIFFPRNKTTLLFMSKFLYFHLETDFFIGKVNMNDLEQD